MSTIFPCVRIGLCSLVAVLFTSCSQKIPPVPASAPSFERFLANLEYGRPAWSPDGGAIFFSGGLPEQSRVFRTTLTGSEPVDVLKRPDCGNVAVNRATKRMAYNFYRPGVALEIWTSDLDGTSPHQVTTDGYNALPEWSPDGSQVAFMSFPDRIAKVVALNDGAVKTLGPSLCSAVWCPTGERLGFIEGRSDHGTYQLRLVSLKDESRSSLKSTLVSNVPLNLFDKMLFGFDWSPDGKTVVWPLLVEGGQVRLALIDVEADKLLRILPTEGWASEPRFSPDGRSIAYSLENTAHVRGIRIISIEGNDDRALTPQRDFVKAEFVHYPSDGGLQIPCFLFRPPAGGRAKKPAIVWLHGGGGIGAALEEFDSAIQYFVANGFVVLQPNFRTSRGFGREFVTGVTGKDIVADVVAAADYLKRTGEVDPARIATFGASFGGYAVLRTITSRPQTFAAAVDMNGPCDLAALYRDMPTQRPMMSVLLGGSLEQSPERYREESPIYLADRVAIPLLIIHGTVDETVPYRQSELLAAALGKAGKSCKLLTYGGVGHGFRGQVWANAMQNSMAFFADKLNLTGHSGSQ